VGPGDEGRGEQPREVAGAFDEHLVLVELLAAPFAPPQRERQVGAPEPEQLEHRRTAQRSNTCEKPRAMRRGSAGERGGVPQPGPGTKRMARPDVVLNRSVCDKARTTLDAQLSVEGASHPVRDGGIATRKPEHQGIATGDFPEAGAE
jgi:hypothetical protein